MIALDTNVLVRYLVEDDPSQSAQAARVIESGVQNGESFFIPQIVLCELVWVLSHAYSLSRSEIADLLQQLRRASAVVIEAPDEVQRAIGSYEHGKGDFADSLIAERATAHGCSAVVTFDRALASDRRFKGV